MEKIKFDSKNLQENIVKKLSNMKSTELFDFGFTFNYQVKVGATIFEEKNASFNYYQMDSIYPILNQSDEFLTIETNYSFYFDKLKTKKLLVCDSSGKIFSFYCSKKEFQTELLGIIKIAIESFNQKQFRFLKKNKKIFLLEKEYQKALAIVNAMPDEEGEEDDKEK